MWAAIDFSSFILLFYRFVDVGKYGESHQANQSEQWGGQCCLGYAAETSGASEDLKYQRQKTCPPKGNRSFQSIR